MRSQWAGRCIAGLSLLILPVLSTATISAHEPKVEMIRAPFVGVIFPEDEEDDAWVVEVTEDGPAAKAGVKAGDTITKMESDNVKSVKQFRDLLKNKKSGDVVKLTVRRGTKSIVLSLTLGQKGL